MKKLTWLHCLVIVLAVTSFACGDDAEAGPDDGGVSDTGGGGRGGKGGGGGAGKAGSSGNEDDGGLPNDVDASNGGGAGASGSGGGGDCKGEDGCYDCAPHDKKDLEFLNHCTDSSCSPFDNAKRLKNWDGKYPLPDPA